MSQTMLETQTSTYTCISCNIQYVTAEEQRKHYRSDHHRYNMKRRVAGLPPLKEEVFDQKVLERRAETAIMASPKGSTCEICSKTYTTENGYRSHIASKKHRENEIARARAPPPSEREDVPAEAARVSSEPSAPSSSKQSTIETATEQLQAVTLTVDEDASEEQINSTIDSKIAASRARLSPSACLFCPTISGSLEENLTHMSAAHSFFVPDAEYLVDLVGLVTYLGEKIAVGNVCIYCNGRGREFRTLDAVRKHMLDKGHCKIAYDAEPDRLELGDFYDFTSSYPDAEQRKKRKEARKAAKAGEDDEEWDSDEDVADEDVDEVVEVDASDSDSEDSVDDDQITYGDTPYELVLPSGARIGHRAMRRYYAQSFPGAPRGGKPEDPNSGAALVRRLLADKNSALVPRKGGFGAYGGGTDVVKARNAGEAREAGRHIREFRDQAKRDAFNTRVGITHNYQIHFRAPFLQ